MTTRRKFIHLSSAATALAMTSPLPTIAADAPTANTGNRKRGLGISRKRPALSAKLSNVRANWFYSWGSLPPAETVPAGVEFVPMIYRYAGKPDSAAKVAEAAALAKKAGVKEMLGFNEPEKKKQGNMTLEAALDAWPVLMETGLRLGSPGCAHPHKEWMIAFMEGIKKRGLRVDFVCVHNYGGPNPDALVQLLQKVHKMFKCPLWITEFAVGDWSAKTVQQNKHKPETVLRFMEQVLPKLDKLDFLERYAWFPAKPDSGPLGTSALFDDTGKLTRLGECYRDA